MLVLAGAVAAYSYYDDYYYDDYYYDDPYYNSGCCCGPMFALVGVGAFALSKRQ